MIEVKITAQDKLGRQTVNALIHLPEDIVEIEISKIISDLKPIQVVLSNGEEILLEDCDFFVNGQSFSC